MAKYKITVEDMNDFLDIIGHNRVSDVDEFFGPLQSMLFRKKWTQKEIRRIGSLVDDGMWQPLNILFTEKAKHKLYIKYYPYPPSTVEKKDIPSINSKMDLIEYIEQRTLRTNTSIKKVY
jgi:hypothetical protein